MYCEFSNFSPCISLHYKLDNDKVPEGKRGSTFGVLAGLGSASFVAGTLAALTFQVGAVFSMIALVYMRIFLEDSVPAGAAMTQPLLKCEVDSSKITTGTFKKLPSAGDLISMLKCSPTFSQAVVLFFSSLADGGLMASLLYYLKARFQFNKNQFADLMMISGIGATLTMITIRYEYVGMVQGCLSGISSLANIISPLVSSPLTGVFLLLWLAKLAATTALRPWPEMGQKKHTLTLGSTALGGKYRKFKVKLSWKKNYMNPLA
ncbi:hypothetical protein Lal_00000397 [Lupinus albus]|nr:hypothetical protein Lal_00000397 [Lupinus albus]